MKATSILLNPSGVRAGVCCSLDYRGTWGTAGTFTQSGAIEDTAEAVRFLRDPANAEKYRSNPNRLVIVGHSMDGVLAGYEATLAFRSFSRGHRSVRSPESRISGSCFQQQMKHPRGPDSARGILLRRPLPGVPGSDLRKSDRSPP